MCERKGFYHRDIDLIYIYFMPMSVPTSAWMFSVLTTYGMVRLDSLLHRAGPLWYNGDTKKMARNRIGQRGAGHMGDDLPICLCRLVSMVEHIVHIDGAPEPSAPSGRCSEAEAY